MDKSKTLYVVSGFMRTGTSMMMRALEASGMDAVSRPKRDEMKDKHADDYYNPNRGGLYELNREEYLALDFPKGFEGKLIKALSMAIPTMNVMENGIRVVFMRRDQEEIRQSYLAFFNSNLNMRKFNERIEYIIERINNRKDVLSLDIFWYRDVIVDPIKYFNLLKESGWNIDVEKAAGIVDPEQCRYRRENLTVGII